MTNIEKMSKDKKTIRIVFAAVAGGIFLISSNLFASEIKSQAPVKANQQVVLSK